MVLNLNYSVVDDLIRALKSVDLSVKDPYIHMGRKASSLLPNLLDKLCESRLCISNLKKNRISVNVGTSVTLNGMDIKLINKLLGF